MSQSFSVFILRCDCSISSFAMFFIALHISVSSMPLLYLLLHDWKHNHYYKHNYLFGNFLRGICQVDLPENRILGFDENVIVVQLYDYV